MKRCLYTLLILAAMPFATLSKPWTAEEFPNPNIDVNKCGRRGVPSWICDPDGVIENESANVVEGVLKEIHDGKRPYALAPCGSEGMKGFQVAVALMKRMRYDGDASEAAKVFARKLHDRWGVGDPQCNNGVLLFLSVEDRQIYVSTGAGATTRLTYDVLGTIIDDVRPALKDTRYEDAVEQAVVDIGLALAGHAIEPGSGSKGFGRDDAIGLAIFGVTAGGLMFWAARTERRKRRRYNDCKTKLEKLKRDQAAMRARSYNPTSCPVCLEDFAEPPSTAADSVGAGGGTSGTEVAASAANDGTAAGVPSSKAAGGASGGLVGKVTGGDEEAELRQPLMQAGSGGLSEGVGGGSGARFEVDAPAGPAAGAGGAGEAATPSAPPLPASATPAAPRLPLVLPCGHAFCEPCITAWLEQKKTTCPICRKPVDDDDAAAADPRDAQAPRPPRPSSGNHNHDSGDSGSGAGPSSGSRPPCSAEFEEDAYEGASAPAFASSPRWGGAASTGQTPRLRLRWAGRRRMGPLQEDMLISEMLFRLRQLQRQHPEYISHSMVHSWEQDLQNGRELNSQQLRDFQLRDPATRQALANSGSSGSSVRFGGGGSRGGGGRGGSW